MLVPIPVCEYRKFKETIEPNSIVKWQGDTVIAVNQWSGFLFKVERVNAPDVLVFAKDILQLEVTTPCEV